MRRVSAIGRHLLEPAPLGGAGASGATAPAAPELPAGLLEDRCGEVEWRLRCKLAVAYRISAHYGWDQLVFNHITVKIPDTSKLENGPHFLINPFGLRFDEVTASSLIKVDLAGNVIERGTASGILFKQGFVVHSAVHQARPELQCVWHSHHADTTAVSMTKFGLLPISQEAIAFQGRISYHPFEGTATDLSERERMAASLGPVNRVMLLINHGPLTAGGSIEEAFIYHYLITLACTWQIKALSAAGGDLARMHIPTEEDLQRLYQRARNSADRNRDEVDQKNESYNDGLAMWLAGVRMMESKHGPEMYT
uniref:Class II aldolase/adducin N-terminal domain-containing protein n=1 Tax=Zooxanthella nutricula TaxID=1333877 RepID=A0A6U9EZL6_9DINO